MKKTKLIFLLVLAICSAVVAGYVYYNDGLSREYKAEAAATDNVAGFAWSENIGWISFNSINCDMNDDEIVDVGAPLGCPPGGTKRYGVKVNLGSADRELSGYAWNEKVGWITFDKSIAGNPPQPPYNGGELYMAKMAPTGEVSGWARALSNGGGWDGWIKLREDTKNYGVLKSGNEFTGYAWSDMVTGWISFNCSNTGCPAGNYKVYLSGGIPQLGLNIPPPVDYCAEDLPGAVYLSWNFDDPDDLAQTAYEIEITRNDGVICSSGRRTSPNENLLGSEINNFSSIPDDFGSTDPDCTDFIAYGGYTYQWKLRAFDSSGNENLGGFKNGVDFPSSPTPFHSYPRPQFIYTPNVGLKQYMAITFDPSLTSIDPDLYITQIEWDWGDGNSDINDVPAFPGVNLSETIVHSYATIGLKTVDLKIKDSDGKECWASQRGNQEVLDIGSNKPRWNETSP